MKKHNFYMIKLDLLMQILKIRTDSAGMMIGGLNGNISSLFHQERSMLIKRGIFHTAYSPNRPRFPLGEFHDSLYEDLSRLEGRKYEEE